MYTIMLVLIFTIQVYYQSLSLQSTLRYYYDSFTSLTDYQCTYLLFQVELDLAVCRKLQRVSGIAVAACVDIIGSRLSTGETEFD